MKKIHLHIAFFFTCLFLVSCTPKNDNTEKAQITSNQFFNTLNLPYFSSSKNQNNKHKIDFSALKNFKIGENEDEDIFFAVGVISWNTNKKGYIVSTLEDGVTNEWLYQQENPTSKLNPPILLAYEYRDDDQSGLRISLFMDLNGDSEADLIQREIISNTPDSLSLEHPIQDSVWAFLFENGSFVRTQAFSSEKLKANF